MTLNLWVLKDWLSDLSPKICCKNPKNEISGLRLYRPGVQMDDCALYVASSDAFFQDGSDRIVCKYQSDHLTLDTDDLLAAVNRIQDAFRFYGRWFTKCNQAISNGCALSDLVRCAAEVFSTPIMVVNAAQILVAQSSDLTAVLAPEDRDNMAEHKSLPEEKLRRFNQIYKDSFFNPGIITIPAGFFPTKSYCKHLFADEERLGTVILKAPEGDMSPGTLYLLRLFASLIEKWIRSNAENASAFRLTANFTRVLDGRTGTLPTLHRQLLLFGWSADCKKQLFVICAPSGSAHLDMRLTRALSNEELGVYAVAYQEQVVVLCNLEMMEQKEFAANLVKIMRERGYCGASSFPFTSLDQLYGSYRQALTALDHSPHAPGALYRCQDIAMRMVTKVVDEYTASSLLHPALSAIREYDRRHKTEYCRTLFCFLRNERRQQQTAEELFIHRNTLTLRLEKIHELWPLDMEDGEERFYLLFSFYQEQYAGTSEEPESRRPVKQRRSHDGF